MNALHQKVGNVFLKDLIAIKGVKSKVVDLQEQPVYNQFENQKEIDVGSCDRMALLQCMLNGDYTESETSFGNYDSLKYDYLPDIEIKYDLKTDSEHFVIKHKGAFINETRTRIIIIQASSSLAKEKVSNLI